MKQYEVEWSDGMMTRMTSLNQRETYAGLLEGIPTHDTNERFHIHSLVNSKERGKRLLLWAPQNRVEGWPETFMGSPTAALPAVTCIAEFNHHFPARDKKMDGSYVSVAWFQEEWAFPIIPEVLAKIRSLAWHEVAIDYEW